MKKVFSIILCLVMALSIFTVIPISVSAEDVDIAKVGTEKDLAESGGLSLDNLKAKFPQGAYWNHVVTDWSTTADSLMDRWDNSYADSVTYSPCATHNGYASAGQLDCNAFNGAIQCRGFGKKISFDAYGSDFYSWGKKDNDLSGCKVGDIMIYHGYDVSNAEFGHTVMIVGVNGTTLTFGECNYGPHCQIRWDRTVNYASVNLGWTELYSAPYSLAGSAADNSAPVISNARAENISANSFDIKCDLSDDVGVTRVWLNIYGPSGQNGYAVSASNGAFSHTIYTSGYGGSGLYTVHIYAFDAAGHQTSSAVNNINATNDTSAPVITNPHAENISGSSFDIKCELSDNVGVTRVWLNIYGPGGQNGYAVSAKNGTFTHTVNTSDYGGAGVYAVHIYAFDANGNETPSSVRVYACNKPIAILEFNNQKYELFNSRTTWKHAKEICESRGGHLAVINSSGENQALANLSSSLSNYVWIGGTDEDAEGNWRWINGDSFSYTNWYEGEPSNSDGVEHYMGILGSSGKWNDAANDNPYISGFICEYEPENNILGDVDGDGKVSVLDATAIQKHLANISQDKYNEGAADADGDKKISVLDATAIQKHLAHLATNENIGKPID